VTGWSPLDWGLAMLGTTCGLDLLRRVLDDWSAIRAHVRGWRS